LFDQSIEYDIAGKAENVIHAVVLAPRHCFLSAVMAVTANGDVGLGPVSVDASNQAAEKLAHLLARWGLAGAQDHNNRSAGRRIVEMDRQKAPLIIARVPPRQLPVALHNVDRVVDVQHHGTAAASDSFGTKYQRACK
jgi:hypothetical protein